MEQALQRIVPEKDGLYKHSLEGSDDMRMFNNKNSHTSTENNNCFTKTSWKLAAHVKASLFGASLTIPIQNGKLALGTWQGQY